MTRMLLAAVVVGVGGGEAVWQWQVQEFGSKADLRGVSAVSAVVAWVSGTKGTFGRTVDGGKTWMVGVVAGAEALDFRDVEAFGESTAYLMSAGPAEASRIYKTTDGGKNWTLQFTNGEASGFFDSMAFWDEQHGMVLSDPVGGRWYLIATEDGGRTWRALPEAGRPKALEKEGAFAASGTCLAVSGENSACFCTGGAERGRVFRSQDRGKSWSAVETPIGAGVESAGAFSIAMRDAEHGIVVGGDYRKPEGLGPNAAVTRDGGKTWLVSREPRPFRSGVAWAKDRWVAVGTSGSDVSTDGGATWKRVDHGNFNAVSFGKNGEGWAVGPKGRVAKWVGEH